MPDTADPEAQREPAARDAQREPAARDAQREPAARDAQREQWSAAAHAWLRWSGVFEAGARPVGERMLELARVGEGDCVLDVATGTGEPALSAARRVGPRGRVLATDLALPMLALARGRARAAGLANVAFAQCDGELPPLLPGSVDAALARFGLMLFTDPERALRALGRALRPGGRVAVAVWSTAERVPLIAIPGRVAKREIGLESPPPDAPGPLRMGRPGRLAEELERAGLRDVRAETIVATFEFASAEEFARFHQDLSARLREALLPEPPEARERLWREVAREAAAHATAGGRIRLANEVHVAVGSR